MKCIVIFLLAITLALALDDPSDDISFDEYQTSNDINFSNSVEKRFREQVFNSKRSEIRKHNANPKNTYKKGINKFSHMSSEEFIESRCRSILPEDLMEGAVNASEIPYKTPKAGIPDSLDLRYLMLPVQDQRSCGSCWAFATMAQLEGMMKKRSSSFNTVLSPQYLVDCDSADAGCNGGWPTTAMNFIKNNGNAAPSWSNYPYTAYRGGCRSTSKIALGISSVYGLYTGGNEEQLRSLVANYGPQVVAIYATGNFQSYRSGVFYDTTCPSGTSCNNVNHAVVVVGYGTDSSRGAYWLVKNSWGSGWGESGYIKMSRNRNNNCNIACYPMFSI